LGVWLSVVVLIFFCRRFRAGGWLVGEKGKDMLEEQPVLFRRSPSRRRLRPGFDTDDRGWTSLHVFARKGDLKLVI